MTTSVKEQLIDGQSYKMLSKTGSDGQTNRGKNAKKGKKVDDNKW